MIIYLGDLFHTWTKGGIWTIPLNVGYVASYTKKKLNQSNIDCEIKIFKDANKLLDKIKEKKPDIVGLGYFVWNENLNIRIKAGRALANLSVNDEIKVLIAKRGAIKACIRILENKDEYAPTRVLRQNISDPPTIPTALKPLWRSLCAKSPRHIGYYLNVGVAKLGYTVVRDFLLANSSWPKESFIPEFVGEDSCALAGICA